MLENVPVFMLLGVSCGTAFVFGFIAALIVKARLAKPTDDGDKDNADWWKNR